MKTDMQAVFGALAESFPLESLEKQREDLWFFRGENRNVKALLRTLKEDYGFAHLAFFTAVDRIEEERFDLLYMVRNPGTGIEVGLQIGIPREESTAESIHTLWAAAATYQQELREMFGIEFPGSPGLYEDFALEGWQDLPPMRRDFDTRKYSEETYFPRPGREDTDVRSHMKGKLYPSEAESW